MQGCIGSQMSRVNHFLTTACVVGLVCGVGCVSPQTACSHSVARQVARRVSPDFRQEEPFSLNSFEGDLTEEYAVAVGLWNSPGYRELLADLAIARADVIEAAQLRNPQISTFLPVGPKQWEFALSLPLDVLWLRPVRLAAAQLESERVASRLTQDGLNTVRDIRNAWIDWRVATIRASLAEEGARLRNEIRRVAQARLDAGAVAELDVNAIRLDAMVGDGDELRTQRDVEVARERLRFLLGLQQTDFTVHSGTMDLQCPESVDFDVDALVAEAVVSRPDIRAVELAVIAANTRAEVARRDIWQLSAFLPDINSRGREGFEAGPGLLMNVPVLHQNQGAVARAYADAERLRRQHVNRKDSAAMEVRQAYAQVLQAEQDLKVWRDRILPQAREALTAAEAALAEDSVSLLLMLETTRQFLTAQQRELDAKAQFRRAVAELERSVGRRLFGSASIDGLIRPPAPTLAAPMSADSAEQGRGTFQAVVDDAEKPKDESRQRR